MRIGYLGTGSWGYCLAYLLASKGYEVVCWGIEASVVHQLNEKREHPFLRGYKAPDNMRFTTDLQETLENADLIVESVTSAGLRSVCERLKSMNQCSVPFVITSKGIEQKTGLSLPEVAVEVFGSHAKDFVGIISGPSFAQEVVQGLPTSVVASAYSVDVMQKISDAFTTPFFRVYTNSDILGVAYGGALKNVIAIACGISDGLGLGNSSKAALMTRGLHEISKLAVARGCESQTLYGLSGMGDLCLTCGSLMSRNYRFGYLLAEGMNTSEAQKKIGMVVEGSYTCVSVLKLGRELQIPMPITEVVHKIIYEGMNPKEAVQLLMQRKIKEEHL